MTQVSPGYKCKAILRASDKTIILSLVISFWFAVGKKNTTSKNKGHEFSVMLLKADNILRGTTLKTSKLKKRNIQRALLVMKLIIWFLSDICWQSYRDEVLQLLGWCGGNNPSWSWTSWVITCSTVIPAAFRVQPEVSTGSSQGRHTKSNIPSCLHSQLRQIWNSQFNCPQVQVWSVGESQSTLSKTFFLILYFNCAFLIAFHTFVNLFYLTEFYSVTLFLQHALKRMCYFVLLTRLGALEWSGQTLECQTSHV